jgi:GDP-L-fucose synthase
MREEYLLTGPLEVTNEPYAVAKIAGVKMCQSYNRQYGTSFISVMPTNLYGADDNFDLVTSHVLPALIRKFHLAKLAAQGDWGAIDGDETRFGPIPEEIKASLVSISKSCGQSSAVPSADSLVPSGVPSGVLLWGSGTPRREFLHVDDLADACTFLMKLEDDEFQSLLTADRLPLINIGWGKDIGVKELALLIKKIVGFDGDIVFDKTKPDGTPRKLLHVAKLAELGWKPNISLRKGIEMTYKWYLQEVSA